MFLFLHLHEPHAPYAAPERFGALAPYDGAIAYADEILGRLVRYLKASQLYDQSTIVLVSDHGEGLGDHGEQGHGLFLYDEAIHIPLIIKQAGGADAGRRVADLVQQADIVPTVLDLVKAPVPGNLRGRSLKPLADGTGTRPPEQTVYAETLYGQQPLRVERARIAHRRRAPVHPRAARGALRSEATIRGSATTSRPRRRLTIVEETSKRAQAPAR